MLSTSGSSIRGELTIDTDPIAVVHARLNRKMQQNGMRQEVIVAAREWAAKHAFMQGVPELLDILSQDCDTTKGH
jgi:hypothetical protein